MAVQDKEFKTYAEAFGISIDVSFTDEERKAFRAALDDMSKELNKLLENTAFLIIDEEE